MRWCFSARWVVDPIVVKLCGELVPKTNHFQYLDQICKNRKRFQPQGPSSMDEVEKCIRILCDSNISLR